MHPFRDRSAAGIALQDRAASRASQRVEYSGQSASPAGRSDRPYACQFAQHNRFGFIYPICGSGAAPGTKAPGSACTGL